MTEVHVCDVALGKADTLITARTLAVAQRKLGDLFACLTDLSCLKLGEPRWGLITQDKTLHLRITLVPRRQLLLNLTIPRQRKLSSLEEEAQFVFAQIQQAQVKVTRLYRQLVARAAGEPFLPDDPVSEMLLKHSTKQWRAKRLGTVVRLDFPGIQDTKVDEECFSVQGVVGHVHSQYLELIHVTAPACIGEVLTRLRLDRSDLADDAWRDLGRIGAPLSADVRFHRCLFTRRILGASLSAADNSGQPTTGASAPHAP